MKKPWHKHNFQNSFRLGHKVVQRCDCGLVRSNIYDFDNKEYVWVDGNLHDDKISPIFVVAANLEDFEEAQHAIRELNLLGEHDVIWLQAPQLLRRYPASLVFFKGEWWDKENYLDLQLGDKINKIMSGEYV